MAEFFVESGQSEDVALNEPALQGVFIPGLDNPLQSDGLGVVVGWGSGPTSRVYGGYGPSTAEGYGDTQLRDLADSIISPAGQVSYNLEGLTGPQGPPGPQGPAGVTTIQQVLFPFNTGVANVGNLLDQLKNWDAAADTLVYGGSTHVVWYEPWLPMPIDSYSSWNEAAIDHDGSFMLVASDDGIFVSTDTGANWAKKTPDTEDFTQASISDAGATAVVLGEDSRDYGKIWTSSDSGANWSQVSLAL